MSFVMLFLKKSPPFYNLILHLRVSVQWDVHKLMGGHIFEMHAFQIKVYTVGCQVILQLIWGDICLSMYTPNGMISVPCCVP